MRGRWCSRAFAALLGVLAALPAAPARADDLAEAQRLAEQAAQRNEQARYDEALALAERARALRERALGGAHPLVASSLNDLARVYTEKGDLASAEPLYKRALGIVEKALGADSPDVAACVNNLAELYSKKGDLGRAEPLYQRALGIFEKATDPVPLAFALNNLAQLYKDKGEYARAEPLFLRSLAIRERVFGEGHPAIALLLNNLAGLYENQGEYARAEPLLERAISIRERALGEGHPAVADSLNTLAALYHLRGEYGRAEALLRRALAIREQTQGQAHPAVALALNNLAVLLQEKGDLGRAEPLYKRALEVQEQALGPAHPDVANSLNNLAELYRARGDLGRAEPLYQRALSIQEKALGRSHPAVATTLSNLSELYSDREEYARAEPLLLRALGIEEMALGAVHPAVATTLNNLSQLYHARGDNARAEPLLLRALGIRETALGPAHPAVANSLNNLAGLYKSKGEYARAEPLYLRALRIWEAALGASHLECATAHGNLAALYAASGRIEEASREEAQSFAIEDKNAEIILAMGSEVQKRAYMATLSTSTSAKISMHVKEAPRSAEAARTAITAVLRRKGRVLDTVADSIATLRRHLTPSDQALFDRLSSVKSELGAELFRGPGKRSSGEYKRHLLSLDAEREKLDAEISARSAAFRAERGSVSIEQVKGAIPEGAALVELVRYKPFNPRNGELLSRWGEPRYVAYLLRPGGDPAFADLGAAAAIDAAVEKLRAALADHDLTHDPRPAARALDALVMQPVRALLGETRWVLLSPDDALNLVPFEALVDEQGRYLVERFAFTYLTSGRDLLRLASREPAREGALVVADPDFGAHGAPAPAQGQRETRGGERAVDMTRVRFPPLPGTRNEALAVRKALPDARLLLSAEATESAVKAVKGPRILHLATHGFFLPEPRAPERGTDRNSQAIAAAVQRKSPLLRAGIALAGANARQSGDDDGILTALEASALDLGGTKLVVLSACETGVGDAVSGEGVYGMRRALVMAGAETQVMSLWEVDSGATRELMTAYYERLREGGGRAEALRQVELTMLSRKETAHPNLWASFIVSGDFRALDGAPATPDFSVRPGPRGCACSEAGLGSAESGGGLWIAAAAAAGVAGRRRRRRLSWVWAVILGFFVLASTEARAADPGEAQRLLAEAESLAWQKRYDEAIPIAQKALALREKALGAFDPAVADALSTLAWPYLQKLDIPRAEALYQRALAIRERAFGPDHLDVARALQDLALAYDTGARFSRAEPLLVRALGIREKILGPEHPDIAETLDKLADVYARKGDYGRAESLYLRALRIQEKGLAPDHLALVGTVNGLGILYEMKGEYTRAEPYYQRVLEIREKTLGADDPRLLPHLKSLITLYRFKREEARAEPLLLRVLAIQEKTVGPDHPDLTATLGALVTIYQLKGNNTRAEPLLKRVLSIQEKAKGPLHPDVADALYLLSLVSWFKKDIAGAEPLLERALMIREKAFGPDDMRVGAVLSILGDVSQAKGDLARAQVLFERVLRLWEKAMGPDHPLIGLALSNLAALHVTAGRPQEALKAQARSVAIKDKDATRFLSLGSEKLKLESMDTLANDTGQTISLHVRSLPSDTQAKRLAFTTILQRKGRVVDAMADSFAVLRRHLRRDDQALLDRLSAVRSQLATQAARGRGGLSLEEHERKLQELEDERQELEQQISKRSAEFRAEHKAVTLEEVQAAIPAGAALVEILRYKPFDAKAAFPGDRWGRPRYVAYVLGPRGDLSFADLGEASPIDAAVRTLREKLSDHNLTRDPKPAARAVDRLVMQPLRALLGAARWALLSPDGDLNLIPFEALVDEEGRYLIERFAFTYLTSGRDLLRRGARAAPARGALIVAAPAYGEAAAHPKGEPERAAQRGLRSVDMTRVSFPPLPSTAAEARAVARGLSDAEVLLGEQATEEAVKAVKSPRILHLATHGFFFPDAPGDDGERENPLLRAGLALAGANARESGASDDGILTALEVSSMDLRGTKLVVLSACQTGLGEAVSGEGVYGLRRALLTAGAETQVMSLWEVDSAATVQLMTAYYDRLRKGAGRSEALRGAALSLLSHKQTSHPNLWASFIVSGDFRTLDDVQVTPDLSVRPGPRGCACSEAGEGSPGWVGLASLCLVLGATTGRRRAINRVGGGVWRSRRAAPRTSFPCVGCARGRCRARCRR